MSCGSHKDPAKNERSNSVVEYFKDAEIQAETDEQRAEIKLVLSDLLSLPGDELKLKKYPDYQNKADQWDVIKFLNSYFVAASPKVLSPDTFFEDLGKPEAHATIQKQINRIAGYLESSTDSTLQKNK